MVEANLWSGKSRGLKTAATAVGELGYLGGGFGGSGAEGDDGHVAARGGALLAVGEEEVRAASGAEVDGVDVLGAEARD